MSVGAFKFELCEECQQLNLEKPLMPGDRLDFRADQGLVLPETYCKGLIASACRGQCAPDRSHLPNLVFTGQAACGNFHCGLPAQAAFPTYFQIFNFAFCRVRDFRVAFGRLYPCVECM